MISTGEVRGNEASSLIRRRRAQMLVHSYLYYWCDDPIVSDHQWQKWADELRELQQQHPEPIDFYDKEFADWTGATGMHLPRDSWVRTTATYLFRLHFHRSSPP